MILLWLEISFVLSSTPVELGGKKIEGKSRRVVYFWNRQICEIFFGIRHIGFRSGRQKLHSESYRLLKFDRLIDRTFEIRLLHIEVLKKLSMFM